MAITYDPIATTTLGSDVASYTFSSISSSYTDLILVTTIKSVSADASLALRFNSDSASNYSTTRIVTAGASIYNQYQTSDTSIRIGIANTTEAVTITQINNYANANARKCVMAHGGNSGAYLSYATGMWRSNSAISSILVFDYNNVNLKAGSVLSLYGIKAA